ncbi:hypothetical protein EC973_006904 [Apophysomyces ossiformis]|uniref:HCP-like protein n=1 Tax=Apophysomyces ossiformis TaxID=679940 RepID=A0A8H7EQ56_9FUNG|nr:hypothetical protein EC973_006904 [Apophysomyces ossiformis]
MLRRKRFSHARYHGKKAKSHGESEDDSSRSEQQSESTWTSLSYSPEIYNFLQAPSNIQSIKQVQSICEQARATGDRDTQLRVCQALMEVARQTLSMLGGLPSPSSSSFSSSKNKAPSVEFSQAVAYEAQQLLKKLTSTIDGPGRYMDREAQFLLGNSFGDDAVGLQVNHERAFQYYVQASKQNHPEATYRTAVCLELGIGTRSDRSRAAAFYRKAAYLSHSQSMYKLAIMVFRTNRREAVRWLRRATVCGDCVQALHALAMLHFGFADSPEFIADPAYGVQLLERAAQRNHIPSQVRLGQVFETEWAMDPHRSIYWYSRAAFQGSADAALALSAWYLTGSENVLEQSDQQAYMWASKAAMTKQHETMYNAYFVVGLYSECGVGLNSPSIEEAMAWYSKAAAGGHAAAAERLGQLRQLHSPET